MDGEKKKAKAKKAEMVEVKPLKDFKCFFDKEYVMKKGEKLEVPKSLMANLKTEKVI